MTQIHQGIQRDMYEELSGSRPLGGAGGAAIEDQLKRHHGLR